MRCGGRCTPKKRPLQKRKAGVKSPGPPDPIPPYGITVLKPHPARWPETGYRTETRFAHRRPADPGGRVAVLKPGPGKVTASRWRKSLRAAQS